MSFIPTVTCRRCGHQYSAVHRRCPNCGTRRVEQSGRTPAGTPSTVKGTAENSRAAVNTKWQMIFGLILVAAIIIAVIVLVTVSLKGENAKPTATIPVNTAAVQPTSTPAAPTPTPTPTVSVSKITINYYNSERTEFALSVGDTTPMNATVYPVEFKDKVTWSVSDETKISITTNEDGTCTVKGLAKGSAKLIAECGGVKAECTVYVN